VEITIVIFMTYLFVPSTTYKILACIFLSKLTLYFGSLPNKKYFGFRSHSPNTLHISRVSEMTDKRRIESSCREIICRFEKTYCSATREFLFLFVTSCVLFHCVCIALLHTSVAALLARSRYPEGPATGHLGTGFSWFPRV